MLGRTHEAFAAVCWLGGSLAVNEAMTRAGHDAPVTLLVALAGAPLAIAPAAGQNSPDMDSQTPLRFFVRHRGVTHSVGLAMVLTALSVVAYMGLLETIGRHELGYLTPLAPLVFAPVAGWWSHLLGDRMFGGRSPVRVGGFVERVTRLSLPVLAGALIAATVAAR